MIFSDITLASESLTTLAACFFLTYYTGKRRLFFEFYLHILYLVFHVGTWDNMTNIYFIIFLQHHDLV